MNKNQSRERFQSSCSPTDVLLSTILPQISNVKLLSFVELLGVDKVYSCLLFYFMFDKIFYDQY